MHGTNDAVEETGWFCIPAAKRSRAMANAPLTGLTVLILDDEPLLRRHLAATLERLGADVVTADSIAAARRHAFGRALAAAARAAQPGWRRRLRVT